MARITKQEILKKFQAVGKAALAYDIEDSHCGNLAHRYVNEKGKEFVAITATGSQKGAIEENDICYPGMKETTFGHYKASSETDIHAAILSIEGVEASMHAHTKYAIMETFDDEDKPNEPRPLIPIDPLGVYGLKGKVPVRWYAVPCGSPQMVNFIPRDLKDRPATMVQAHGTFCKGKTLEEAFYYLCLANNSGYILHVARRLGVDVKALQEKVMQNPSTFFHHQPAAYASEQSGVCDFKDEQQTVKEFIKTGFRIFESRISPFHTGSISLRCVDTVLFAPKGSMPAGLPSPLLELPLVEEKDDSEMLKIHKGIYANSSFQSIIHAYIPDAEAAAQYRYPGAEEPADRIIPIDGEGSFLYPVIPILPPSADFDQLLRALHDYNVVVIRGGGVWAVGEQSLSEVLHHPSSVRDICMYREAAIARGLDIRKIEPDKAKKW